MANENNRMPLQKVNYFDGMNPQNIDFQADQDNGLQHTSYVVNDFMGSGVLQKNPVALPPILDTSNPDKNNISFAVINAGNFDGAGIFVDRQVTDTLYGDQLLLILDNVEIPIYNKTKIIIFGKIYDPLSPQGLPTLECITFDRPGKKATFNYFKSVIAVFFNNFSGGIGRTDLISTSQNSINTSAIGLVGRLVIREVEPLQVLDHSLILSQTNTPNIDIRDFITSTITRKFIDELTFVVNSAQNAQYIPVTLNDLNQLPLNTGGVATKPFLDNTTNGMLYGQKCYFTTNNIQQLSILLSLDDDAYGWSGEFVIGFRPLQIRSINQFSNQIDLDPDINILFEASFTQSDLLNAGYVLSTIPQEIKFNFIGTNIAQPNGIIIPNKYYIITLSRRADTSIGKIIIEVGPKELDNSRFTVFNPLTKAWSDDVETDVWFKVYSASIRVSAGIAYTTSGKMISLQKTALTNTGSVISMIAGPYSLSTIDSVASDNVVILQSTEQFQVPGEHPRTGNLVFLRITDSATITVLNVANFNILVASVNSLKNIEMPIVLAVVNDFNGTGNTVYNGVITLPGQVRKNQIVLFNTNISDSVLELNNIITPNNSSAGIKYRIIKAETTTQYLGDFNNDKIFTSSDLIRQANIQDIFSAQSTNTLTGTSFNPYSIFDTRSRDILGFGEENVEDFILADIDGYLTINSDDIARLQYLTTTLPAYISPSPTVISTQVLTLENITNNNNAILVEQINDLDGYAIAIFPDQIKFTALNASDMRSLSLGDRVTLSADGYIGSDGTFINKAYSNMPIKKFIQRNDLILETRFLSNVIPVVDTSYILSFYNQNPIADNKLGIFGEIATEVLEFVVTGIDLFMSNIVPGDIVVLSSDLLMPSRAGSYTISEILSSTTFRISSPLSQISSGIATSGIEIFGNDGVTSKLQDIAVDKFGLNTVNLIISGIVPGDIMHITLGPGAINGTYQIARILNSTTLTVIPPLAPLVQEPFSVLINLLTIPATTITVDSTVGFQNTGTLLIDNEQIIYGSKTSTTFTSLTRGANGTTASIHNINTVVSNTFAASFEIKDSGDSATKLALTALTGVTISNGPVFPEVETLAPASLPNGIDSVFEFTLTHIPVTGTVTVHWISGGISKAMIFNAAPVQIIGDGNVLNSSIDRINGMVLIDTFIPPDVGTMISSDYRIAPIVTLKNCYPTVVNAISSFETDIEFKIPAINASAVTDINGVRLCPYVVIQTNNSEPPDIVKDLLGNVVAGSVQPNTINATADGYVLPSRNVVLQVTDVAGNIANIVSGNYWMQVYSGERVNITAIQKEFLSDSLSLSSFINWTIRKNNFEWRSSGMSIQDRRRLLPTTFTAVSDKKYSSMNEMWFPSDLYVGNGEILSSRGVPYHGDLEITKINLELPVTALLSNSIDIYNNLIASFAPTPGITRGGQRAMKFSDGTYVGADDVGINTALTKNQIRLTPAISSIYLDGYKIPNANIYTDLDEVLTKLHYEIRMGMFYDDINGVIYFHTENIKGIFKDEPIVQTGIVRIVADVSLKKSGFKNPVVSINSTDILRLFANPVVVIPDNRYSISGTIVAGFTVGITNSNPDG